MKFRIGKRLKKEIMGDLTFTVFTSAYNCADTIHRVWDSLNSQTYRNFEWIVVNDNSPDNLDEILENYKKEANFPMKVFKHEENLGKHFAWNLAAKEIRGEFFVPADADDSFVPETLETFLKLWKDIPKKGKHRYSGINVLCKEAETNKIVGNKYPKSPLKSNNLELFYKYRLKGEKWGMLRSDIIKRYKFPELKTSKGTYEENYLWYLLAEKGYNVMCYNIPLRNYYTNGGPSITYKNKQDPTLGANVKYSYLTWHVNRHLPYMLQYKRFDELAKSIVNILRNGFLLDKGINTTIKNSRNGLIKLLLLTFAFPSYLIYLKTYAKYKNNQSTV